jgi:hypothetical protein
MNDVTRIVSPWGEVMYGGPLVDGIAVCEDTPERALRAAQRLVDAQAAGASHEDLVRLAQSHLPYLPGESWAEEWEGACPDEAQNGA